MKPGSRPENKTHEHFTCSVSFGMLILDPVQLESISFAILQRVQMLPWLYLWQEASWLLAYLLAVGNESVSTNRKGSLECSSDERVSRLGRRWSLDML